MNRAIVTGLRSIPGSFLLLTSIPTTMNKRLLISFLSTLLSFAVAAQLRLNVEGDAQIRGSLDLVQGPDDFSIFIGPEAGMSDNGLNNQSIFIGPYAGRANVNGLYSTFIGYEAGLQTTIGLSNTFIGHSTGYHNLSGGANTFLGNYAGYNNLTATGNTFLGHQAGSINVSGEFNTYVGHSSGYFSESGTGNTYIGFRTGSLNPGTNFDNAIAIGNGARVNCSGCAVLGGLGQSAVNVGIGTSTPRGALHLLTIGDPPAGLSATENGLLLGVAGTASYKWIQSYGGALALNSEGNNVGISTALPNYRLEVNGSAGKPGGGDWTNSASDRRLKRNIRPYEDGLKQLLQIKPVWYRYNGKTNLPTDREYVGIIAQEMQGIAPYTIGSFNYEGTEYLNYDGSAIRYMLVNAVKEQQATINELELQAQQQQGEIDRLKALVEQLIAERDPEDTNGSSYTIDLAPTPILHQNQPNPFQQNTVIRFHIPKGIRQAVLQISTAGGKQLQELEIGTRGTGQVTVRTDSFPSGTYYYTLILDGEAFATKPMIINQ